MLDKQLLFKSSSCIASRRSLTVSMQWLRNETRARHFLSSKLILSYIINSDPTLLNWIPNLAKRSIAPLALTVFINGLLILEKGAFLAMGISKTHITI